MRPRHSIDNNNSLAWEENVKVWDSQASEANMSPHTYGAGTRLSSAYTAGRNGLPLPRHSAVRGSAAAKAWQQGHDERLRVLHRLGIVPPSTGVKQTRDEQAQILDDAATFYLRYNPSRTSEDTAWPDALRAGAKSLRQAFAKMPIPSSEIPLCGSCGQRKAACDGC